MATVTTSISKEAYVNTLTNNNDLLNKKIEDVKSDMENTANDINKKVESNDKKIEDVKDNVVESIEKLNNNTKAMIADVREDIKDVAKKDDIPNVNKKIVIPLTIVFVGFGIWFSILIILSILGTKNMINDKIDSLSTSVEIPNKASVEKGNDAESNLSGISDKYTGNTFSGQNQTYFSYIPTDDGKVYTLISDKELQLDSYHLPTAEENGYYDTFQCMVWSQGESPTQIIDKYIFYVKFHSYNAQDDNNLFVGEDNYGNHIEIIAPILLSQDDESKINIKITRPSDGAVDPSAINDYVTTAEMVRLIQE